MNFFVKKKQKIFWWLQKLFIRTCYKICNECLQTITKSGQPIVCPICEPKRTLDYCEHCKGIMNFRLCQKFVIASIEEFHTIILDFKAYTSSQDVKFPFMVVQCIVKRKSQMKIELKSKLDSNKITNIIIYTLVIQQSL